MIIWFSAQSAHAVLLLQYRVTAYRRLGGTMFKLNDVDILSITATPHHSIGENYEETPVAAITTPVSPLLVTATPRHLLTAG